MAQRDNELMTLNEVSLRAALNLLRDSVESKRMPSGVPLEGDGLALHELAIDHLDDLLRKLQARAARGA